MTFLAIDVGNTRLKWALYPQPRIGARPLAQGAEFLEHIDKLAEGPWSTLPPPQHMLGCIVAGDAINAILVAAGHNLRLLIAWFAALLRAICSLWLLPEHALVR